jgi:ABC-type uncharacterized transport system involved in gliding motility auxiliary subunit
MSEASPARRGAITTAALLLIAVLFVAVNVAGTGLLAGFRADLTQERLFTLSPGTRSVLAQLQEPVTLRFYYSERLGREIPSYGVYATRVREILQEYRAASRGRLRLELIDPQPFTDDEDRAVSFGLQGVPINQTGETVYFGLAGTNTADKEETIGFFQPERERFLEYDLTRLVYNLSVTRKPPVGVLSTLPIWGEFRGMRQAGQPWAIYTQLAQFFDVRRMETTVTEIAADINVLVIIHPREFPEPLLYAIDQFVMRGGRVIAFLDPLSEFESQRQGMQGMPPGMAGGGPSALPRLMESWGVEMVEQRIAADRRAAIRVSAGNDGTRVRAVDYVAWLQLRPENFTTSDVLLADVSNLRFASAGILRRREGATTTMTPLVQTGLQSQQIEVERVQMMPNPVALLANFQPSNERLTLAARITGPVRSAFPDGPPPPTAPAETPAQQGAQPAQPPAPQPAPANPNHLREARAPANMIIIADTDLLDDRFWVQAQEFFGQRILTPNANNGDFVINATDNLSGSDALISLRARGQSQRPFTLVQEIQGNAEQRFRAKERELTERLRETEQRVRQLREGGGEQAQGGATGGAPGAAAPRTVISREQQEAIDRFRAQVLQIRRELRDVQQQLRQDIQGLEAWVKFINIGLLPFAIACLALVIGIVRNRRRRSAARATESVHAGAAA